MEVVPVFPIPVLYALKRIIGDPTPLGGFDLISSNSMLHDWPERETGQFIARAGQSLAPFGPVLIFERGLIEVGEKNLPLPLPASEGYS